ncbi:MAG: HAMP domain-containing sensor histidine kinase [Acidobacteriota bacterium]
MDSSRGDSPPVTPDEARDLGRAERDDRLREKRLRVDRNADPPPASEGGLARERRKSSTEAIKAERLSSDAALNDERRESDRRSLSDGIVQKTEVGRIQGLLDTESLALSDAIGALNLRDEFLAIVSHDLRNPLNAIALNARLVARHATGGGPLARIAMALGESVVQMDRIISDLLDVASIEAGKLSVVPRPGDARLPVREAVDMFREATSERSVSLEAALPEVPLPASFDGARVVQVLQNLLGNAIQFTPEMGNISVAAQSSGKFVAIGVRDSGPGIASDQIGAIFERFRQVEKRGRKGLGLGLYISRSIVEAHGGRIWAESSPGYGSTFTFTLPAA